MAKPKLGLIPAAQGSKFYSVLPSSGVGDFDFTRSGGATRINSQGLIETVASGVSRLNYPLIDGKVVGCPSHLLEPQRINTLSYSEDFTQGYWNSGGATVSSNDAISPDGTQTADLITVNSGSADGGVFRFGTWNTTLQTFSLFAKKGNHNRVQLGQASNGWWATFDLEDGYVVSQNGNLTNSKIVDYGNGWYRCIVSHDNPSATATLSAKIVGANNSVYFWGAMLEIGSYQTSYIPNLTTGSTTRSAETANGSGDAATFNDSEGVLMAEIFIEEDIDSNVNISISDGVHEQNVVKFIYLPSENSFKSEIIVSAVYTTVVDYNFNLGEFNKVLLSYNSTTLKMYVNGFEVGSSNVNALPTGLSELNFDRADGVAPFYGNTKQVQYYNSALTDSELETLTSWNSFTDMANSQQYSLY